MKNILVYKEKYVKLVYKDIAPIYKVSNLGNIININTGKKLSIKSKANGYPKCNLKVTSKHKKGFKTFKIHKLVANTFVEKPDDYDLNKYVVNHKDGDKTNNCYTNLEWVSQSYNLKHAYRKKLRKSNSYYSDSEIDIICKYIEEGLRNIEIFNILNKNNNLPKKKIMQNISNIRNHKRWIAISSKYNF